VVVMRDAGAGFELYLVKRSRMVDFMAGAHVFPGGRLEEADGSLEACAVRETFEEAGLRLDPAALVPWVRWITPVVSPRRFDARFFLARAPEGQEPQVDGHEATEGLWITPAGALRRWEEGSMLLAPATAKSVEMLSSHASVGEALARRCRWSGTTRRAGAPTFPCRATRATHCPTCSAAASGAFTWRRGATARWRPGRRRCEGSAVLG